MLLQAHGVATCILISFVPGLQLSDEIGSLLLALRQPGLRQCLQLDSCLYRPVQVVQDLDENFEGLAPQRRHLLIGQETVVVALLELALGDAGERVDDADADVFLANVAIVVCKYFEDVLCVLAQTVEEVKDAVFAIVLGVAGVEHSEEEIVDEDADGLLEVLAEVEEEQMEYGHCPREDLLL
jgi:hypothetical protein